jgi:hypothetical protein
MRALKSLLEADSMRKSLATPKTIIALLAVQIIPLLLFPADSWTTKTQEWWLPVLLTFLAFLGFVQIVFRRSTTLAPWHLISFAHGFNIISRLMMILPHATMNIDGVRFIDAPYLIMAFISMFASGFYLWYTELPEIRLGLIRQV